MAWYKNKAETIAPKQVVKKVEPSKVDIESKPIKVKDVAYDTNNTTEINNAEFEELWNKAFSDIKITDKMKLYTRIRQPPSVQNMLRHVMVWLKNNNLYILSFHC